MTALLVFPVSLVLMDSGYETNSMALIWLAAFLISLTIATINHQYFFLFFLHTLFLLCRVYQVYVDRR